MRSRVSCLLLSLLLSLLFVAYGARSLNVSAALSGGRFMTTQECLDTFGSSFSVSYWDGSQIVQTTALYDSTATFGTVAAVAQTDYMQPGRSCLAYTFQGSVSSSPEQIQIDISPQYSLFDIDQLHTAILTPANATYTNPYQSPQWIWMLGGQRTVFEGLSSSGGEMYRTYVDNRLCIYCPVDWTSQSLTSGYSVRATFCSGSLVPVDGVYYIYIGVPYVTTSAEGSNGTVASSGTSVSGDINVNVDMTATNGLLDGILSLLEGLLDGIAGLFIPDADFLEDFSSDLEAAAVEHLGGVWEAEQLVEDHLAVFTDTAASGSITIPSASIPLAGETFVFPPAGSNVVDLKPDELENSAFSLLYDGLALIVDFLAVASFLNMCKKKVELFLLPDTEVITD